MDFGFRLNALLRQIGTTQKDFSALINIQPAVLSRYINNKTVPSIDFIMIIKTAIPNLNLNWLLIGDGDIFISHSTDPKVVIKNGDKIVGSVENKGIGFQEIREENEYTVSFNKLYSETINYNINDFFKIQFKKFESTIEEEIYNQKRIKSV